MTRVTRSFNVIRCMGHAGDKVPCAMLTALTVALVANITERLGEHPNFKLQDGLFEIDCTGLSMDSKVLVDSYLYALKGLSESYPNNFKYLI